MAASYQITSSSVWWAIARNVVEEPARRLIAQIRQQVRNAPRRDRAANPRIAHVVVTDVFAEAEPRQLGRNLIVEAVLFGLVQTGGNLCLNFDEFRGVIGQLGIDAAGDDGLNLAKSRRDTARRSHRRRTWK